MVHNPYSTPAADLATPAFAGGEPVRIYSPTQAACGALVGGPVGLIYFLYANFGVLGNAEAQRKTVAWGVALIVALVILLPLLPDRMPSTPLTVAYMLAAQQVAVKHQMTKAAIIASPQHDFHSNWRVFGLGLLTMVGTGVAVLVPIGVLAYFGLVS
ncbi:MAG: hypothetical protein K0S46_2429 [Moraxellaceae bacterium]|nr:hypothetical protein [Moraxellaceae bacterium]